jgi:2'-5' RNA ligase
MHPAMAGCIILIGLMMKKRIFIGIKVNPSSALLLKISELKSFLLNSEIKWVELDNMHVTLMFLGDVEVSQLPEISLHLESISKSFKPFEIKLVGFGKFGTHKSSSVIWVGIKQAKDLILLADRIAGAMCNLGFEKENRPFKPHLTIGRVKTYCNEENLSQFIERNTHNIWQHIEIKEFILYESLLQPSRPKYKALEYFGF